MSSTSIGREAETHVAEYLKKQGYKLLAQNWRTRFCEIDLVMSMKSVVYFIEVKYRSRDGQGSGLDYITSKKLKQMEYAAEIWMSKHNWKDDAQLAVVEMAGQMDSEPKLVLL